MTGLGRNENPPTRQGQVRNPASERDLAHPSGDRSARDSRQIARLGIRPTLGGLTRLFAPEAQQPPASVGMYAFLNAGFAVGCFLTYKATGTEATSEVPEIGG